MIHLDRLVAHEMYLLELLTSVAPNINCDGCMNRIHYFFFVKGVLHGPTKYNYSK